jgi:hypothetical protein
MSLLNVRLSEDDARLVRALQKRGIAISELVRRAIREEAAAVRHPANTDEILRDMTTRFPMPGRPKVRSTNRRAVQAEIRKRLRRRR